MNADSDLVQSLIDPMDTTEFDSENLIDDEKKLKKDAKKKLKKDAKKKLKKDPKIKIEYKCHIECCTYRTNHVFKLEAHHLNEHGVFSKFICLKCKIFKFQSADPERMAKHLKNYHNIQIVDQLDVNEKIYFQKIVFDDCDNLILKNLIVTDENTKRDYLDSKISKDFFDKYGAYNYEGCEKLLNDQLNEKLLNDLLNENLSNVQFVEKYLFAYKDFKHIIERNLFFDFFNSIPSTSRSNDDYVDSLSTSDCSDNYFNFLAIHKGNIVHELEQKNVMNLAKFKLIKKRIFGYICNDEIQTKLDELYENDYYLIPLNSNMKKECCLFIHNCMIRIIKYGLENRTDTDRLHDNNFILDHDDFNPEKIVHLSLYLFVEFFVKFCEEINKLKQKINQMMNENSIKGTFKIEYINQSADDILPNNHMELE